MPVDPDTRAALSDLVDRYGSAVDDRDDAAFAALFAADAEVRIFQPGEDEPAVVVRGEAIASVPRPLRAYAATQHHMGGRVFDVDGAECTGRTSCTARHLVAAGGRDPSCLVMVITYRDRFVREDGGPWCIGRRDVHIAWWERCAARRERLRM